MAQIKLNQVLTESQMLKKFGFSKPQLDSLRTKDKFPYVKVCKGVNVYIEMDVIHWLLNRRIGLKVST
jgi:predicted DNA-binding transcriptional regulator AlpA